MAPNVKIPPGVRFAPSDQTLLTYYLRAKLLGQDLPWTNDIQEEDLYERDPEVYAKDQKYPVYFFTKRNRRCGLKYRCKRKAGAKSWRHTDQPFADVTTQMPVTDIRGSGQEIIGWRRTLIYFNGEEKTNWRMHEYIIPPGPILDSLAELKSDTWVLCKTFREESDAPEDEQPQVEESGDSEDEQPHSEGEAVSVKLDEHPPPVLGVPIAQPVIHWPPGITACSREPVAHMVEMEAFKTGLIPRNTGLIPRWHSNIPEGNLTSGAMTFLQKTGHYGLWRAYAVFPLPAPPANAYPLPAPSPHHPRPPPPTPGSMGNCTYFI